MLTGLTALLWKHALRAGHLILQDHQPSASEPISAVSPFIDAHAHLDPADPKRSIEGALQAMPAENAAKMGHPGYG